MVSTAALLLSIGTWFVADDTAGGGAQGALYASVSAVVVAMIGGTVAVVTNRNRDDHPNVRYVDPPTSNALPAAMAELYEHVKDENERLRGQLEAKTIEAGLWERRAIQAGWDE